ncbi:iron uptake protein [Roseateles chitinivorans]|uniref:Iron uptake protein n=1 Tax=Roseateles chitinivorans TaxID=2917965 RepID=A0A2G9CH70_9BURK|nr:iron uptake protein [Roseateles chitinivorans]PIM54974.1 iron uptake protein [Roseateles chitinivorans]
MTDTAPPPSRTPSRLPPLALLSRIGAAILGGYAFCWGFIAVVHAGLYSLGMPFHDAEHLAAILAVLLYLAVFLWTFAARRTGLIWAVLLVGGGLMTGAAALIQRALLT